VSVTITHRNDRKPCRGMFKTARLWQLFAMFASMSVLPAQAATYHDLQDIRQSSVSFIHSQLGVSPDNSTDIIVSAGQLDVRLRLSKCNKTLDHHLPQGRKVQGRIAVGVACNDGKNKWSIFVPVTITQYADIVVTSQPVSRGTPLESADLRVERRSLNNLHNGYIKSLKQAQGTILKTSLPAGAVITPNQIKRQYAIKRGQTVNILAKSRVIAVRSKGKALANARIGEKIKVKNLATDKIVEGTVSYNGSIEIKL